MYRELKFAMSHDEAERLLNSKKGNPDCSISGLEFARMNAHIKDDGCKICFEKGKEIGLFMDISKGKAE